MRAIADLAIVVPADPAEVRAAIRWAATHDGPSYIRIGRSPVPAVNNDDVIFAPGTATQLRDGRDATVIAMGTMVSRALEAADELQVGGVSVRVLNMASVEPFDREAVLRAAYDTPAGIVTVEEATTTGGLGAAVATVLAQTRPTPMRVLGVPRMFAPTGSTEYLLEHFGLTAAGIITAVRELLTDARP
jgi:transketolase